MFRPLTYDLVEAPLAMITASGQALQTWIWGFFAILRSSSVALLTWMKTVIWVQVLQLSH